MGSLPNIGDVSSMSPWFEIGLKEENWFNKSERRQELKHVVLLNMNLTCWRMVILILFHDALLRPPLFEDLLEVLDTY